MKPIIVNGKRYTANEFANANYLISDGDLDISETDAYMFPEHLRVKGNLIACETYIKVFPESLIVDYGIDLSYTQLETFPDNRLVNGGLSIGYCLNYKHLSKNLHVRGDFIAFNTGLEDISGITADNVDVSFSPIKTIGGGEFEHLNLSYTNLEHIPDDVFAKYCWLIYTKIKELPKSNRFGSISIAPSDLLRIMENYQWSGTDSYPYEILIYNKATGRFETVVEYMLRVFGNDPDAFYNKIVNGYTNELDAVVFKMTYSDILLD